MHDMSVCETPQCMPGHMLRAKHCAKMSRMLHTSRAAHVRAVYSLRMESMLHCGAVGAGWEQHDVRCAAASHVLSNTCFVPREASCECK